MAAAQQFSILVFVERRVWKVNARVTARWTGVRAGNLRPKGREQRMDLPAGKGVAVGSVKGTIRNRVTHETPRTCQKPVAGMEGLH